jgi:FAD/FMN-containing dehydrogenase
VGGSRSWRVRRGSGRAGCWRSFEEGAVDAQVFFDADTWRLLRALRTHWDPNGLFLANHEIKES